MNERSLIGGALLALAALATVGITSGTKEKLRRQPSTEDVTPGAIYERIGQSNDDDEDSRQVALGWA